MKEWMAYRQRQAQTPRESAVDERRAYREGKAEDDGATTPPAPGRDRKNEFSL